MTVHMGRTCTPSYASGYIYVFTYLLGVRTYGIIINPSSDYECHERYALGAVWAGGLH